jgi:hypothetical protein
MGLSMLSSVVSQAMGEARIIIFSLHNRVLKTLPYLGLSLYNKTYLPVT